VARQALYDQCAAAVLTGLLANGLTKGQTVPGKLTVGRAARGVHRLVSGRCHSDQLRSL
jgi:hypothetical protein